MADSSTPKYPEDFQKAVDDLIDNWEGGYAFDPADPGGVTKFGISKAAYPLLDIVHLTRDQAVAIYYRDYWVKPGMQTIAGPVMRAKVFNMGVLMGPKTAILLSVGCNTLDQYRQVCERHFQAIVIKHPECGKFLAGWTRRALA